MVDYQVPKPQTGSSNNTREQQGFLWALYGYLRTFSKSVHFMWSYPFEVKLVTSGPGFVSWCINSFILRLSFLFSKMNPKRPWCQRDKASSCAALQLCFSSSVVLMSTRNIWWVCSSSTTLQHNSEFVTVYRHRCRITFISTNRCQCNNLLTLNLIIYSKVSVADLRAQLQTLTFMFIASDAVVIMKLGHYSFICTKTAEQRKECEWSVKSC